MRIKDSTYKARLEIAAAKELKRIAKRNMVAHVGDSWDENGNHNFVVDVTSNHHIIYTYLTSNEGGSWGTIWEDDLEWYNEQDEGNIDGFTIKEVYDIIREDAGIIRKAKEISSALIERYTKQYDNKHNK